MSGQLQVPQTSYLHIPAAYAAYLGGLRWSGPGDAVEHQDGTTFALTHEIALFLEGFVAGRRLIHFGFVLHLLHLLGQGKHSVSTQALPLRRAFQDTGRSLRNAGALCAELCRSVPPVAEPIDLDFSSRLWVTNSSLMSLLCAASETGAFEQVAEAPPLDPLTFEGRVLAALANFSTEELHHWFRHGCGPGKKRSEAIAQALATVRPRTLGSILAELSRRRRLAGAIPLVSQMVSALALPPRKLTPPDLPLGGYADVTTRGQPEQLLPSQFALDDLEFVRRFAGNELLYFRREEPQVQLREELVLLLDQGVRTWGDVRLVLSAAVFALSKRADMRGITLRLACTSTGGRLIDPLQTDAATLGALLEASDLSPHPGLALERVLEEPATVARDVVLLTQPRNLGEADVAAAARRVGKETRLFAVTVDEHGQAELGEIRHGIPVSVHRFRVDLSRLGPEPPDSAEKAPATPVTVWQGAVEPVGFPFRFGVVGRLSALAFDQSGEWLMMVGPNGILHVGRLDQPHTEVWKRAMIPAELMTEVEAVLGVAGGFVVCGKLGSDLVAAHYNLANRNCTIHTLQPTRIGFFGTGEWFYFPTEHSVVLRQRDRAHAVDLTTGEKAGSLDARHSNPRRVHRACDEALRFPLPPPRLAILKEGMSERPAFSLDPGTGILTMIGFREYFESWAPFTPMADGLPVLEHSRCVEAQCCGNTLALSTFRLDQPDRLTLRLFRGPVGIPIAEYPLHHSLARFALSNGGHRLAVQTKPSQVTVYDLSAGSAPIWCTSPGRCHPDLGIELGDRWLLIHVGLLMHLLRWDGDELVHRQMRGQWATFLQSELAETSLHRTGVPATKPNMSYHWYYRKRFQKAALGSVIAAVDGFGQVTMIDWSNAVICMFYVFRDKLAAWTQDGTRWGPPSITGGPATPGALAKIGQALRAASERGRKQS